MELYILLEFIYEKIQRVCIIVIKITVNFNIDVHTASLVSTVYYWNHWYFRSRVKNSPGGHVENLSLTVPCPHWLLMVPLASPILCKFPDWKPPEEEI